MIDNKVWSPSRAEASELCDSQGTAEFLCSSECNHSIIALYFLDKSYGKAINKQTYYKMKDSVLISTTVVCLILLTNTSLFCIS